MTAAAPQRREAGEGVLSRGALAVYHVLVYQGLLLLTASPGIALLLTLRADASNLPLAALAAVPSIPAADVTHVITVSCTGFYAPGPDFVLARDLGLRAGVQRYHLGFMGCYASMPALRPCSTRRAVATRSTSSSAPVRSTGPTPTPPVFRRCPRRSAFRRPWPRR